MKIGVRLGLMMAVIVAPVALAAALSSRALYDAERDAHTQRYLERVRALRLALDTELDGTVRMLRIFVGRPTLVSPDALAAHTMSDPLERMLAQNPMWSSLAVVETDGRVSAERRRPGEALAPALDDATRRAVIERAAPAVSALVGTPGADPVTYVAVPALAGGRVVRIAAVGIRASEWLGFLQRHPIAEDATLTMNDQAGLVIARTLNHEQWVGRRSRPEYLERIARSREGAMRNTGLEGQDFYTAFSRLTEAPWTLGTGVPADVVEAGLRSQTRLMVGGLLLAVLAACAVSLWLGRGITDALARLAALARPGASPGADDRPLAIEEAERVRRDLRQALDDAAAARADAEHARTQAEAANQGKDAFLATLAHELRNPISAMLASVTLLEARRPQAQPDAQAHQVLRRQIGQLSMLVNDMLDAARASAGKLAMHRSDVDLAQVVASVVQTMLRSGRLQHLNVRTGLRPATVHADPMRLEQVVVNLLDNAAKFTDRGGHLSVRVDTLEGSAVLTVADDGIGIDPARLPDLFDAFAQAHAGLDRSRDGLGLGLHVVKALVELQGGTISADSAGPGRGATFVVRLPLAGPALNRPAEITDVLGASLPPLRVALAGADDATRESAARLLRMAGHEVRVAVDAEGALQLIADEQPDVALVDLGLAGVDGAEIVRRLPGCRCLLIGLAGDADDTMRDKARAAGYQGLLRRTFDLPAFEAAVTGLDPKRSPPGARRLNDTA